jgi:hypothetical protein
MRRRRRPTEGLAIAISPERPDFLYSATILVFLQAFLLRGSITKGEGFWVNASSNIILNLGTSTVPSGHGGTVFDGIEMNGMSFATDTIGCNASLTYRNVSTYALSPFLYFDIVAGGVIVGDQIFRHLGLAPGAIKQETQYVYSRGYLACNTFTLQFNAAASVTH